MLHESTMSEDPEGGDRDSSSESSSHPSSSSSGSESDLRDIQSADMRWSQMKRVAQKKRAHHGGVNRLKGLISADEMKRQHGLKRMKEGLQFILQMHSPVELSSICGCLRLKVQQKAAISMNLIVKFACEEEEINEKRIREILRFSYEGVLWEYLQSLGHPVHSMLPDPRDTILQIWRDGGLLGNNFSFVPHFVRREVPRRCDWKVSADVQARLDKIVKEQDKCKQAERKVIAEHDYTNILAYFQATAQLRGLEAQTRDYLISELEVARAHLESDQDQARGYRQQCVDAELQLISVSERLNYELAHSEFVAAQVLRRSAEVTAELVRLEEVVRSYVAAEEDRSRAGGGTAAATKLRQADRAHICVRQIHETLMRYRDMRDLRDDQLRQRGRCHVHEITVLREVNEALGAELDHMRDYGARHRAYADKVTRELVLAHREAARRQALHSHEVRLLTQMVNRLAAAGAKRDQALRRCRGVLLAACTVSDERLRALGLLCVQQLELVGQGAPAQELQETVAMAEEDMLSTHLREQTLREEEDRRLLSDQMERDLAARSRSKRGGRATGRSAGTKSPSKASSTTASGPASPSNARPSSKGASAPSPLTKSAKSKKK